jgi:predicted O-methyltransferase YrrM
VSVLAHLIKWALGIAQPEVWTTPAERDCLARHAAGRRRLAEIGVWHAGTSVRLRAAMAPEGTLYAIDPYEKGRLGFSIPRVVGRRELERVRNGRVVWVRKAGAEAARSADIRDAGPFDFVFVDDAQTYETLRVEWEAWSPLVGPGGIIALHDSRPIPADGSEEQSSVRYTREVVLKDQRFEVLEVVDSVTVLRRREH